MDKLPDFLLKRVVWDDTKNPIWLSSSLQINRNFALDKFPGKMSPLEMTKSLSSIVSSLQKVDAFKPLTFFPAEELSPLDKEFIVEQFQSPEQFQNTQKGQGFAFDSTGKYFITINCNNHLQIQLIESSEDLPQTWTALSQIDHELEKLHPYAFSPNFGYLTANPLRCGTALEARLTLHVPALFRTGGLKELSEKEELISFTGLEGSLDELVGDLLIIKNRYTLGITEETILSLLQDTTFKLVSAEKSARRRLKEKPSLELQDAIGRAFGVLTHAYQIHPKEALTDLSALKLGIDLEWISGISPQKLSLLMLQLGRGHLIHLLKLQTTDPQTLAHERAAWLQKELKDVTIKR